MTINSALTHAEAERLAARIAELEHERKHLLAVIEILKEASSSLHFIDILQAIARKLGESFGLDRCSIFLGEKGGWQVRLVASYEDPTIRNYVVDLERYPELKKAMQSGETVFIPDAANDPSLRHVKDELINRRVKSITVVPITWRSVRSEEHTSELQSHHDLVCRLLLEKKKKKLILKQLVETENVSINIYMPTKYS